MYPFIPPESFSQFAHELTEALAHTCSFEVTLATMKTFGGKRSGVCWLDPQSDLTEEGAGEEESYKSLTDVYEKVQEVLLAHDEGGGKKSDKERNFRPHLTFNHSRNVIEANELVEAEQEFWAPLTFAVNEVYLLERVMPEDQFHISATVPLGSALLHDSPGAVVFEKPVKFPLMPEEEEEWVKDTKKTLSKKKAPGKT